jgi:hypothetical protein
MTAIGNSCFWLVDFFFSEGHLAQQFQRGTFLEIDQSETRIACGGHVCKQIGTK